MARISDAERIARLLRGGGGSLGRRAIIEELGLSDARYDAVAQELVSAEIAVKNRGRAGGLQLTALKTGRAAEPAERETVRRGLERDMYPGFETYLVGAAKGDKSRSIILRTHTTRAGKWETPDLTEVRVTPFPIIGQWELRVITYELKRQDGWSIESVLQTATYREFAHECWLVAPAGDEDWTEYFGTRLVDKAGDFGIGIATFDDAAKAFKKHLTPEAAHSPGLTRLQDWLEASIDRLGEHAKKKELADNIRWAKSKADAGRD